MSNNPHEASGNAPEENNSEENDNSGSTYFIGPRVVIDDEHEIVQNQIRLQQQLAQQQVRSNFSRVAAANTDEFNIII